MNILRLLLEENPEAIDTADLAVRELRGDALGSALLGVAPSFFEGRIDEQTFFAQVSSAYLPIVDRLRWYQDFNEVALEEVAPTDFEGGLEWTTFVEGRGHRGALLPEDGTQDQAISVFTRVGPQSRALRFFRHGPDVHASVNLSRHCGPPDGAAGCAPGMCGGCRGHKVLVPVPGITCICEHR